MDFAAYAAAFLAVLLVGVNLASLLVAFVRLRLTRQSFPLERPPVSIVIPLRGIEAFTKETLERAFRLDWPDYELLFCVADDGDAVRGPVRAAIRAHPGRQARLLVGDDRVSGNPKLNNCVKGWREAAHEWVIMADSNVLMPPDYIQRLLAGWRDDTGLVCSTPIGSRPTGFAAEIECAWLNSHQARWQYAGEAVGMGFAQGKSMLWFKPMLDANGGIEALGAEIAEDAASTKLVNGLGLKVHLVETPFEQPLGRRTLREIWSRQARWARLRRVTFPLYFAPEILLGIVPPLVFGLAAAAHLGWNIPLVAAAIAFMVYAPEYLLTRAMNWSRGWRYPAAMLARDFIMPAVWLRGWLGAKVEWRGNAMDIRPDVQLLEEALPRA